MTRIRETASAKLNLGLRITGKRPDGFHDILSVFQTVTLHDTLDMEAAVDSTIVCSFPGVPDGPDNLVIRAGKALGQRLDRGFDARYTLDKRIPAGAGLGGGSSDAAAALRGLRRLYPEAGIDDDDLHECAAGLGSDIPFLLRGGTAVVEGRGDRFVAVTWPFDFTYVLVYPGFGVSTAWAYGSLRGFFDDGGLYRTMTACLADGTVTDDDFFGALRNDFEATVFERYPVLAGIRDALLGYGARASLMSGSGSTVFGIFEAGEEAERCAEAMREEFVDVFVAREYRPCRT